MEHREREQGNVREASAQAMVVEPVAAAPVGRRELAALVGALAGLAATSCVSNAQGEAPMEDLGRTAEALTGANLAWVDTVLGAVPTDPPTPRPGDLATKNSANLGNAAVVLAKGCVTAGDGGGGLFYWDSTSPAAPDDGGTVIAPTAGGGCWKRIFSGPINVMWFGARGDGKAADGTDGGGTGGDEKAIVNALAAAIAAGRPLTGGSRTYGIRYELELPANAQLQDITLKQLSPAGSDRRTLTSNGGDNIKLTRVKVNRNGDGGYGSDSFGAAGIFIIGGSGHHFEDVEVWGDGKGSGFVVWLASKFDVVRLHVHDIKYSSSVDPGDDRVQGFWFSGCSDFRVIAP
jgi:hypothetical protein